MEVGLSGNIIVLGSSGLLGGNFYNLYKSKLKLIPSHKDNKSFIDITNFEILDNFIKLHQPEFIVNCAALADVDFCEKNKKKSELVNTTALDFIGKASEKIKSKIIHISTDHVYDSEGYNNIENVNLKNHYALTKFNGEKIIQKYNSIVLRTNFFGNSNNNRMSFTDKIIKQMKKERKMYLFNDVFFNPLRIQTLADILYQIITEKFIKGIFNVGSKNGMSKGEFILKLSKILNINCTFEETSVEKIFNNRPKSMLMDVTKTEKKLDIDFPSLNFELHKEFDSYV